MNGSICWVHIGDLHMDEADGWVSLPRLEAIVEEINTQIGDAADFVFLPGDNANHGTTEQYAAIVSALDALERPWRMIPGDHDFEPGSLAVYEASIPQANRPECEVIAGHRCIFLDIVSAGAGGPDFRLTTHHRNRLMGEIARARAEEQTPLVFMHAFPGDLSADGDSIARILADGRVPFVDTGHTHYNDLLNDGRVIYGATRSTGQIEEGNGVPGYSIVCVHDGCASWRFRETGGTWPHVQIVSPVDIRLITEPSHHHQVCRRGIVRVTARRIGRSTAPMIARLDDDRPQPMTEGTDGLWSAMMGFPDVGLHRLTVTCEDGRDTIEVLVREIDNIPKRSSPVALGHACHSIGAWREAGLLGTRLGPNSNGRDW